MKMFVKALNEASQCDYGSRPPPSDAGGPNDGITSATTSSTMYANTFFPPALRPPRYASSATDGRLPSREQRRIWRDMLRGVSAMLRRMGVESQEHAEVNSNLEAWLLLSDPDRVTRRLRQGIDDAGLRHEYSKRHSYVWTTMSYARTQMPSVGWIP